MNTKKMSCCRIYTSPRRGSGSGVGGCMVIQIQADAPIITAINTITKLVRIHPGIRRGFCLSWRSRFRWSFSGTRSRRFCLRFFSLRCRRDTANNQPFGRDRRLCFPYFNLTATATNHKSEMVTEASENLNDPRRTEVAPSNRIRL